MENDHVFNAHLDPNASDLIGALLRDLSLTFPPDSVDPILHAIERLPEIRDAELRRSTEVALREAEELFARMTGHDVREPERMSAVAPEDRARWTAWAKERAFPLQERLAELSFKVDTHIGERQRERFARAKEESDRDWKEFHDRAAKAPGDGKVIVAVHSVPVSSAARGWEVAEQMLSIISPFSENFETYRLAPSSEKWASMLDLFTVLGPFYGNWLRSANQRSLADQLDKHCSEILTYIRRFQNQTNLLADPEEILQLLDALATFLENSLELTKSARVSTQTSANGNESEAGGAAKEQKSPKKRTSGGRPTIDRAKAAEYRKLVDGWKAAKNAGKKMQDYCNTANCTMKTLKAAIQYTRSRAQNRKHNTPVKGS